MNCRGTALVMGLIFLFGLSLLALSGSSGMILQKHMATNHRDKAVSLNLARFAQFHAKSWLMSQAGTDREPHCSSDCLLPIGIHSDISLSRIAEFESTSWWSNHTVSSGVHPETRKPYMNESSTSGSAHWLIEEINFEPVSETVNDLQINGIGYYRILSRGAVYNPGSRAIVESIVVRPWGIGIDSAEFPPVSSPNSFCRQFADSESLSQACGQVSWRQLQ